MQQERNFDKNTFIAMALMGLMLFAYLYINRPTQEQIQEREKQEQLAAQKAEQQATATSNAAWAEVNPIQTAGAEAKDQEVENTKMKVTFSGKGGSVSEVLLKDYSAYDAKSKDQRKPLYLVNKGNNEFNLKFKDASGAEINTAHLPFSSSVQEMGGKTVVTMSANLNKAQLDYVYTIGDDYNINFEIKSQGLRQISNDGELELNWKMKSNSLEKGKQQEGYWAQTYYRLKESNKVEYELFGADKWTEKEGVDWIAFKQQFFSAVLSFDEGFKTPNGGSELIDEELDPDHSKDYYFVGMVPINGSELNYKMQWDFLPLEYKLLAGEQYEGKKFERLIPFGWGILGWMNRNFFLLIFQWLATIGIGYGWVILLMTIVVKLVLSPVMYKQYRQSAMMRVLRPEINEINEKYKGQDNAMKRQQATMELYRKAGANPLSGCLPALIQIPIFYALFRFFPNVIDLRGKSFYWADDLTAYDSAVLLPDWVPFMNGHLSILALGYVLAMVVYFKISGSMDSFNQPPQEGMPDMRIMKYMMYVMPLFFFVFLNNYASGLSLYYLASNVINIGIVLIIKNVLINDKKILAKIQENKAKPKKQSKWSAKMNELMEQAQEQKKLQEQQKKKKK